MRQRRRPEQLLRRAYHDLVTRRTMTTVSTATHHLNPQQPIFIIGIYRSGTTLLRYILDSHSQIACGPETDFIAHLDELVSDERSMAGLDGLGYDRQHVLQELGRMVHYFHSNYALANGKMRWADKTPRYVDHLDFLHEVFPNAQFILIYRHPLDQVHSSTRGGTHRPWHLEHERAETSDLIDDAARYWSSRAAGMLIFEEENPQSCHRVMYERLCTEPEKVIRNVFDFLEEPYESEVLDLKRHRHDAGFEDSKIRMRDRIELSSGHWRSWPRSTVDTILEETHVPRVALRYPDPSP